MENSKSSIEKDFVELLDNGLKLIDIEKGITGGAVCKIEVPDYCDMYEDKNNDINTPEQFAKRFKEIMIRVITEDPDAIEIFGGLLDDLVTSSISVRYKVYSSVSRFEIKKNKLIEDCVSCGLTIEEFEDEADLLLVRIPFKSYNYGKIDDINGPEDLIKKFKEIQTLIYICSVAGIISKKAKSTKSNMEMVQKAFADYERYEIRTKFEIVDINLTKNVLDYIHYPLKEQFRAFADALDQCISVSYLKNLLLEDD